MKKTSSNLLVTIVLLSVSSLSAFGQTTFTASFESLGSGVELNSMPEWEIITGNAYTGNGNGQVKQPNGADNITAVKADTINWTGESFSFSVDLDMNGTSAAGNGGIVFAMKDANNFYSAFITPNVGAIAVLRTLNGASVSPAPYYRAGIFDNTGPTKDLETLRITVDYIASNSEFTVQFYAVAGALSGQTLANVVFTSTAIADGQFGLYSHWNTAIEIDSFGVTLTPVPEPSHVGLILGILVIALVGLKRRRITR